MSEIISIERRDFSSATVQLTREEVYGIFKMIGCTSVNNRQDHERGGLSEEESRALGCLYREWAHELCTE